jgi:hypothetical protein
VEGENYISPLSPEEGLLFLAKSSQVKLEDDLNLIQQREHARSDTVEDKGRKGEGIDTCRLIVFGLNVFV